MVSLLEPIYISFMFFIEDFIISLYGKDYNIEIFISNNLLINLYFTIHYNSFVKTIRKYKNDIVYKKYKGILILHICFNYIITLVCTVWFIKFIYFGNDILWNIIIAPLLSATISTSFDSRILRGIERQIYRELRNKEFMNYKRSLSKILEVQQLQEKILSLHNQELGELRKNISIVEDMMYLDNDDLNDTEDK